MFDELRHFLLIAEHGTFTAAARAAHLSQPALTASMRRLEERCGARVFHRGRGGATLSAEGEALLPRARAALAAVEDGLRAVAEVGRLDVGRVSLGAGATVTTYLLPPHLGAFAAAHPGVRYSLRECVNEEARDALAKGDLDLAIVSDARAGDIGERWCGDDLVLVGAPGAKAEGAPFVSLAERTNHRAHLAHAFPEADIVMELNSIFAVKANVRAGVGVALLSREAVRRELGEGTLVVLEDPRTPIGRDFFLIHRGLDRLPPATAAFRELLLSASLRE